MLISGVEFVQKLEYNTKFDSDKNGTIVPISTLVLPQNEGQVRPLLTCLNHDGERIKVWADVVQDGEKITAALVQMQFEDRDAACDWIDANQLGRRNLTPDQQTLVLGRRYNRAKKAKGAPVGNNNAEKQIGKSYPIVSTAQKLADQYGVTEKTVRNAGQYAEAVEKVAKAIPTAQITAPRQAVIKAAAMIEKSPERAAIAEAMAVKLQGRHGGDRKSDQEGNISTLIETGKTRDITAAAVGLGSGKTLEAVQRVIVALFRVTFLKKVTRA